MEFRLRASLKTEIELFAMRYDFLYDWLHLVDLDRIDDEVLAFVSIFLLGFLEATGCLLDTIVENVGESEQHGSRDVAQG